jgi:hypothetical protein
MGEGLIGANDAKDEDLNDYVENSKKSKVPSKKTSVSGGQKKEKK